MVISKWMGLFSADIGIDLGTANSYVCQVGTDTLRQEPSVVAVRKGTHEVLLDGEAVGHAAKHMLGRTPLSIEAGRPLQGGVIADFDMAQAMLSHFVRSVPQRRGWLRPRLVITVPPQINTIEKRALFNAAERAGARKVYLLETSRAAGLGAGVPIHEPRAHMIVDIGGGTTDIAVLSLADLVIARSVRLAGEALDEAIIQHMKRNYNILIGPHTAEEIKIALGSAQPFEEERMETVKGRDLLAGLPRAVTVTAEEVRAALSAPLAQIIDAVRSTLEQTGPELSGDLLETGILLCGGSSLLPGLAAVLEEETGLPVRVDHDPLTTVIRGTSVFLARLDAFKDILESAEDDL